MKKNIITKEWLAEFYSEGLKPKYRGALKRTTHKPSSRVTEGTKPQAKGSSFKPKSTSSRIREPE